MFNISLEVLDLLLFDRNSVFVLKWCLAVSSQTLPRFSIARSLLSQVLRVLQWKVSRLFCFLQNRQIF